jgi:hypothetical protein
MKCEAVQNRLLDLLGSDVPTELLVHVDGCELCQRFLERARALDAEIATLPVPSSEAAKLAYLDSLTAAGPVIKTVPSTLARGSVSLRELLAKVPVRPVATAAAAVLVGVGVWSAWPVGGPPVAKADPPRHELLQKVVTLNTELAGVTAPKDRVAKLAGLAADLRSETRALSKAAQKDDMLALAKMYESVVNRGIVTQAEQITMFNTPSPAERKAALKAATAELSRAATEITALVPTASQQVQPLLRRIANTARDGEARLLKHPDGGA